MMEGNDGGACVSQNGGASWSTIYNQPTAQFYHVTADTRFPYRSTGRSRTTRRYACPAIVQGGDPVERLLPGGQLGERPHRGEARQPRHRLLGAVGSAPGGGGSLLRYDHATGQVRNVTVWRRCTSAGARRTSSTASSGPSPSCSRPTTRRSSTRPEHRLPLDERGSELEPISPDLTRGEPSTLEPSGGPITKDTTGAEHYGTVFALAESPTSPASSGPAPTTAGSICRETPGGTGSRSRLRICRVDDHLHHRAVPPRPGQGVSRRHPLQARRYPALSLQDHGLRRHLGADHGWHPARRLHPRDPRGSRAARASLRRDGDGRLRLLRRRDVVVLAPAESPGGPHLRSGGEGAGPVAATHGRSFWILDDLTPLHQWREDGARAGARLFAPRPAYRLMPPIHSGLRPAPGRITCWRSLRRDLHRDDARSRETVRTFLDAGANPPAG